MNLLTKYLNNMKTKRTFIVCVELKDVREARKFERFIKVDNGSFKVMDNVYIANVCYKDAVMLQEEIRNRFGDTPVMVVLLPASMAWMLPKSLSEWINNNV